METARLDKIISDTSGATRSQARAMIKAGRVCVNGKTEAAPDSKFPPEQIELFLDGNRINTQKYRYFVMNKPEGVVCATVDAQQKTVIEILPKELLPLGLFPVGRLDKDTTGLLILTNDGEAGHILTSPRHFVEKRYEAWLNENTTQEDCAAFESGITLRDGTACRPAKLELDPEDSKHAFVTISQGIYHQVKRMFASQGKTVIKLKRLSIGGLCLDGDMEPGQVRELSSEQMKEFFGENIAK